MTAPTTEQTIEVLAQARDLLTEETWGKRALFCDDGRVCALGAIQKALGVTYDYDRHEEIYEDGVSYPDYVDPDEPGYEEYKQQRRQWFLAYGRFNEKYMPAFYALSDAAAALHGEGVANFNDYRATSVDQVKELFDIAINNLKGATVSG